MFYFTCKHGLKYLSPYNQTGGCDGFIVILKRFSFIVVRCCFYSGIILLRHNLGTFQISLLGVNVHGEITPCNPRTVIRITAVTRIILHDIRVFNKC